MQGFNFLPLCLTLLLRTPQTIAVQVTSIRLMNGATPSTRVGRVEIQVNNINTWGSICDDGWDDKEAIVVCRSLGFTNGGIAITDAKYGTGSFIFLMDDSACTGDESSLSECLSSQISDCRQGIDNEAGVECNMNLGPGQPTPAPTTTSTASPSVISGNCQTTPTVRLNGKQGVNGIGYVEVQQPDGSWGFVCDDGWSSQAAKIVCAQMCYPTNYTAKPGIPAESKPTVANPVRVVLDEVHCFGNETTLQNCAHAPWGVTDCLNTDGELAGVQCLAAQYLPPAAPLPVLVCTEGKMVAQFNRTQDPNLETKHLSILNQPNCPFTTNTSTQYVTIIIPVDKCGTRTSRNGTHIIYYNEILYNYTSSEGQSPQITRVNTYRVAISCVLPVHLNATQRVEPVTQAVTQVAVGNFEVWLTIYRNDSFTVPVENPVKFPLGEYLYMVVSMHDYDPNLKLVVTDCVASPTGDFSGGSVRRVLFRDKCRVEDSLTFYPLSNFQFGFRFKPFKFVNYDVLYIYCDSIICLASDNTQECDRTCANSKPNATTTPASSGRKRRSSDIYTASAVSQAIIIYDSLTSVSNSGNSNDNKNDNTNIVVATDQPPVIQNSSKQYEAKSAFTSPVKKDPHSASESGNGGHRIPLCSVLVFVLLFSIFYV
ncbi:hypothetical protein BsWGS_23306 [Bradybaena similaris]